MKVKITFTIINKTLKQYIYDNNSLYPTSIIINDEEKCLNFEESGLLTEYGDIKYYYDHLGRRYKKQIPHHQKV